MLVVLDYISVQYAQQKIDESRRLVMQRFSALNSLRGELRDELEKT